METLKYSVIKSKKQYADYCRCLEAFTTSDNKSNAVTDEIELLTLLIEKWDSDHNSFADADPVMLLKSLMSEKNITATEMSKTLQVSKGLVSDILNYKKGLSKEVIRKLSVLFKVSHEAFNRQYDLRGQTPALATVM